MPNKVCFARHDVIPPMSKIHADATTEVGGFRFLTEPPEVDPSEHGTDGQRRYEHYAKKKFHGAVVQIFKGHCEATEAFSNRSGPPSPRW